MDYSLMEKQLADISMSLYTYTRDIPIFSQITEDEISDIEQSIQDNAETYLELYAIHMYSSKFVHTFIQDLYEQIEYEGTQQGWFHNSVSDVDDPVQYDPEIYWMEKAKESVHSLLDFYNIPPRQICTSEHHFVTNQKLPLDNDKDKDNEHHHNDSDDDNDTIITIPFQDDEELTSMQYIITQETINHLNQLPVQIQRSREWHEIRHNCFSASSIWKLFRTTAQYNSIIYEKCMPLPEHIELGPPCVPEDTSNPRNWGIKYEPLTVMIYEHMYNTTVNTNYGCIRHSDPTLPIGASPDGINDDPTNLVKYGRMVEIKNVVSRHINGIPKDDYWIQTQIQMEVCNLDLCDFVETEFKQYTCRQAFIDGTEHGDKTPEYRGCSLYLVYNGEQPDDNDGSIYIHSPVKYNTVHEIDTWIDSQKLEYDGHYVVYNISYWYLLNYSCVLIKRNETWFTSIISTVQTAWETVQNERISGCEHRAPQSRHKKENGTNSNSTSHANSNTTPTLSATLIAQLDTLDETMNSTNTDTNTNNRQIIVPNHTTTHIPTIIVNKSNS